MFQLPPEGVKIVVTPPTPSPYDNDEVDQEAVGIATNTLPVIDDNSIDERTLSNSYEYWWLSSYSFLSASLWDIYVLKIRPCVVL